MRAWARARALLEQILVVGAVRFAGEFFAGLQKLFGGLRVDGLPGQHGKADGASHADGAQHVQLVGVKNHLGFDALGRFAVVAVAVGADAVLHGGDALGRPTLRGQHFGSKFSRGQMMFLPSAAVG